MTVLIVDDHTDSRAFLQHALQQAGFAVRTAGSGEEALAAIETARPDAVLLDVLMPGIDGFETCVRIRHRDRELPILFMTGLGETEHILKGFQAGGNDYVPKPVSASEVAARLGAHTRTARLVQAARDAIDSNGRTTRPPAAAPAGAARPVDRMTARESEVLRWVALGKTNRDIAEIIGISPRTVNKHLEHVFEKLGVETRTAAAAVAGKMGLDGA